MRSACCLEKMKNRYLQIVYILLASFLMFSTSAHAYKYIYTPSQTPSTSVTITITWQFDQIHHLKEYRNGAFTRNIPYTHWQNSTASGLTEGVYRYEIGVRPIDGGSEVESAFVEVLFNPANPSSTSVSKSKAEIGESVTISWGNVSAAHYYEIDQQVNNGNWVNIATIDGGSPRTHTEPLLYSGKVRYRVRACKNSPYSTKFGCSNGRETPEIEVFPSIEFDVDSHGYAVFSGDFNGDGYTDYYFYSRKRVMILHGDIATPIMLPANPTFIIYGNSSGGHGYPRAESLPDYFLLELTRLKEGIDYFIGDFDGDGKIDFLFRGQKTGELPFIVYGVHQFLLPIGKYDFPAGSALAALIGNRGNSFYIQDINKDGRADLVLKSGSSFIADTAYLSVSGVPTTKRELTEPETRYASLAGKTEAAAGVSASGAATYTIPISVPQGSGGHSPQLALRYSSQGGNGMMGLGWSVSGTSSIRHCRRTLAHDNTTATNKDRFCLDGERLMVMPGHTYGAPGSVYKTEVDSFRTVTAVGGSAGKPDHFLVETKDGKKAKYQFNGHDFYPLSEILDSTGKNRIAYSYDYDSNGFRISQIDYAYDSSGTPNASIKFVYASRPDAIPHELLIGGNDLKRRLSRIEISNNGGNYRTYHIQYLKKPPSSLNASVSRVHSVQECVGSACLPAIAFGWEIMEEMGFSASSYEHNLVSSSRRFNRGRVADLNGNGRADYVYFYKDGDGKRFFRVALSDGQKWIETSFSLRARTDAYNGWHLVDYNGDGRLDLLHAVEDGWAVQLFDGQGFGGETINLGITHSNSRQAIVQDITGNGLPDLMVRKADKRGLDIYYAKAKSGGGFRYEASPDGDIKLVPPVHPAGDHYEIEDIRNFRLQDTNGDGLAELLVPIKQCTGSSCLAGVHWHSINRSGSGFYHSDLYMGMNPISPTNATKFDFIPADLNGDGRSDLIFKDHDDNWSYFIRGVGSGSNRIALPDVTGKKVQLVDYNQDGYLDLVWPANGKLNVKLWNGSGFGPKIVTDVAADTSNEFYEEFADVNGDGYQEYIQIQDTNYTHRVKYHASRISAVANNVIKKINNAQLEESVFTYKPLTDASVYTKGQGAGSASWDQPVFDLTGSTYVVASHQFTVPTAANPDNRESVSYKYEGLRAQAGGRGVLGFAKVTETDPRVGTRVTTFAQEFPYTGMATKMEERSPQGILLSSLENVLDKKSQNGQAPYWPYVKTSTERHYLLKSDGASAGPLYKTSVTSNTYDDYGNLTKSISTTRDAAGQELSKVTQDNFFEGSPWHREKGRVSRTLVTSARGASTETREVAFTYYPQGTVKAGLLETEIIEPNYTESDKDHVQLVTGYGYNDHGNRTKTTKSATGEPDRIANSEYDTQQRYVDKTRDADNRLLTEVRKRNTLGLPTEVRNYLNVTGSSYITTRITYDALGRETQREEDGAPWVKTEYRNCASCNVPGAKTYTTVTSQTGDKVTTYFDALGRKLREQKLGFTTSDSIETRFEYDNLGRIARQSEPHRTGSAPGYWTEYQYDLQSRVKSVKLPDGNSIVHAEPVLQGNHVVSVTTNQNGQKHTETQNALGETVFVEDHYSGKLEYVYDPLGNLRNTISHGRPGENLGITISVTYDKRGRKATLSDPDKGSWSYEYNAFGDLTQQIDGKQQKTVTQYDKYGRPFRRTDYLASGTVEGHTRWYYDDKDAGGVSVPHALGKVTSVVMSKNTGQEICYAATTSYCALYKYNSIGKTSQVVTALGIDGADGAFSTHTEYDAVGRPYRQFDVLDGVVKKNGSALASGIQEHYTNTGRLQRITDLNGNNVGKEIYRVVGTNPRGQVTDFDINSGLVRVKHDFDAAMGHLKLQTATRSAGGTVQQLAYTWDKLGNLTSRHNQRPDSGKKESFCYDHLNRLLQVNANTTSTADCNPNATGTQFQYDSIGNIKSKEGAAYSYASSKPHAVTATGGVSYNYDNNGNLTGDGSGRTFNYTSYDMLSRVQKGEGEGTDSADFFYGPDRARYKRVDTRSNGEVVTTLYLGNVERIHKQSSNSYEWKRYLPGGAVYTYRTDAAFNQQSLTQQYLLTDHIGSTDAVLDSNGNLVSGVQMAFDPWGQRRDPNWQALSIQDLIGNDYSLLKSLNDVTTKGFTGHEMVDALGIIHMNGRIYDPKLGRFLQADPIIDGATNTQGYNRYSYVANNPLSAIDPSGYSKVSKMWKGAWNGIKKGFKSLCGDSCGIGADSNGNIHAWAGSHNPDHGGFWATPGAAGAYGPEGVAPGAFGNGGEYLTYMLEYATSTSENLEAGFNASISGYTADHLLSYVDAYDKFLNYQDAETIAYYSRNESYAVLPLVPVLVFLAKELAAEGLSQATDGASDYLSTRRLATKGVKTAARYLRSNAKDAQAVTRGVDTASGTARQSLRKAKEANGIPRSAQPDRTIKPNTPEGKQLGLDNRNVKLYEYTNSSGQKIHIRQDKAASYGQGGIGDQKPHFNAGPAGQKLKQHHYYGQ